MKGAGLTIVVVDLVLVRKENKIYPFTVAPEEKKR